MIFVRAHKKNGTDDYTDNNNGSVRENGKLTRICEDRLISVFDLEEELRKYYGKEELTDKDLSKVREIFEKSGARDYAIKKMDELFKISKALVLKNRNIPTYYKEILLGFITYLELREN